MVKFVHLYTRMHSDFLQTAEIFLKKGFLSQKSNPQFAMISQGCAGASSH